MRHVPVTLIGAVLLAGCLVVASSPGGDAATAAAEPLSSVESTETPAPASVVHAALVHYRAARRAHGEWVFAKHCLGERPGLHVARRPDREAPAAVWLAAGERWRRQRHDYQQRTEKCVWKMKHPGGSSNGVRWLALARWVGWPAYALPTLAGLIMNESSGRERAVNEAPPYCWGLTQLARGWRIGAWPIRGSHQPFNALDAETCLRKSLGIFRDQGDSFLPAWRGDPAVGW